MTPQEAIELVEQCGLNIEGIKNIECESLIISALEKQIPKKPIKKNPVCYAKTKAGQEYYTFDYFCPRCNEQIQIFEHHCECGQVLDWSDTVSTAL